MSTHDDNLLAGRFAALAPEPLPADWNDVLNRRGAARRRRSWWFPRWRIVAAAAVTLIGGVLVTPAFGVGERLLDLLRDEQRPPEVLSPAWSPDGQKIAFVSNVGGAYEISVMNADGSGLQKLPGTASGAFVWSPDGRMLLFTSESRAGGSPVSAGLYVINVDGTGRRLITRQADLNRPAWSPDGRQIAFMGHEPFTIHVVNKDGSGHRMLADNAFGPVWSPDGEQIAFSGRNDVGASDIFVMNANGTERQNLRATRPRTTAQPGRPTAERSLSSRRAMAVRRSTL